VRKFIRYIRVNFFVICRIDENGFEKLTNYTFLGRKVLMRYYISDLHFYHESLLTKMDCRGFENCDKMHEYMIECWNKKVRENDEVVILGDVSMERGKKTHQHLPS